MSSKRSYNLCPSWILTSETTNGFKPSIQFHSPFESRLDYRIDWLIGWLLTMAKAGARGLRFDRMACSVLHTAQLCKRGPVHLWYAIWFDVADRERLASLVLTQASRELSIVMWIRRQDDHCNRNSNSGYGLKLNPKFNTVASIDADCWVGVGVGGDYCFWLLNLRVVWNQNNAETESWKLKKSVDHLRRLEQLNVMQRNPNYHL